MRCLPYRRNYWEPCLISPVGGVEKTRLIRDIIAAFLGDGKGLARTARERAQAHPFTRPRLLSRLDKFIMEEQVPSFPIYVTLPVCGATLLLVLIEVWRLRDSCATFLL